MTVCAIFSNAATGAALLANFANNAAAFGQVYPALGMDCVQTGQPSGRYQDSGVMTSCPGNAIQTVPCEQPKVLFPNW